MADQSCCSVFKKAWRNKNMRKRTATEDDEIVDSLPSQKPKKTLTSDKALPFSTAISSSKPSGKSDGEIDPESEAGLFHFESSKLIQVQNDSRATASLQTETEFDNDARAIRERVLKRAEESLKGKSRSEVRNGKSYRGINGYTDFKTWVPPRTDNFLREGRRCARSTPRVRVHPGLRKIRLPAGHM